MVLVIGNVLTKVIYQGILATKLLEDRNKPFKKNIIKKRLFNRFFDLSFASTETKFKDPITKTQNNFLANTGFLVKLFQKMPK